MNFIAILNIWLEFDKSRGVESILDDFMLKMKNESLKLAWIGLHNIGNKKLDREMYHKIRQFSYFCGTRTESKSV